ncbi:DUF3093 domain-containing protein [Micromonospora sp. NPDC047527]|uniref:DUF3093 domain-containing protein n=1 Tax=unclassified Micromonospora TaxID=2617518 RepID=UPI0033C323A7
MSPSPSAGRPPVAARPTYAERLDLPWWLWLVGLLAAALLAVEIWMGGTGARAWVPFAVLLPITAAGLWWLGRIRVAVTDSELLVDDARLPVRFVADVVPLDAAGRREVLGVGADPLAFVVQRPWISGAVQVVLNDPADPTPFWVVSSRRPVELAEALLAARDARTPADRRAAEPG